MFAQSVQEGPLAEQLEALRALESGLAAFHGLEEPQGIGDEEYDVFHHGFS
jgi:hypothetical protein